MVFKKVFLSILFVLITSLGFAAVDTHYVTQAGAGGQDGTAIGDAWAIADFNNAAKWDVDVDDDNLIGPGDTVYFSGNFTTSAIVMGSGSAGNYITLDGYETDDTTYKDLTEAAGRAKITLPEVTGQYGFNLSGAGGASGGRDYITIQDFEISGTAAGIYTDYGADHTIIKRNYIHDGREFGIAITLNGDACSYVTIGGALGEGNVIKNFTIGTAGGDIRFAGATDVIVSYNHLYAVDPNKGVDGVTPQDGSHDWLIEYNSVHGHKDASDGEQGMDVKNDGGDIVDATYNGIIRYNNIYDNAEDAIHIQACSHDIYVYGNRMHHEMINGLTLKNNCGDSVTDDRYVFSNIIYEIPGYGLNSTSGVGSFGHSVRVHFFNNTVAEAATGTGYSSAVTALYVSNAQVSSLRIMNNIFYNARQNMSLPDRQMYLEAGLSITGTQLDYNHYYYSGGSATSYVNGASLGVLSHGDGVEANGQEGDPGLTSLAGYDYTIASGSSAVVDEGVDMGSGAIATITIQGVDYPVNWDDAIGPETVWGSGSTLPVIQKVSRDDVGWDIGAYAYVVPITISNLQPDTALVCDAGDPRNVTISIETNVDATCKYDLNDVAYASMANTFSTTGGQNHSKVINLGCDASYTIYTRCSDGVYTSPESTEINFSIDPSPAGDTTPPVISSPLPVTPPEQVCESNPRDVVISVVTTDASPPVTCRACLDGVSGCDSDTAYADMLTNGGFTFDTNSYPNNSHILSRNCGEAFTYQVRCADDEVNVNVSSTQLTFSIIPETPYAFGGASMGSMN